jgi:hypothetical protein
MSTLNVSNITDGTTTVGTSYVVNGSAKAWVNFNGTGTIAARDSFNVASLTDNGTGQYTVNVSSSFSSSNYSPVLTAAQDIGAADVFVSGIISSSFGVQFVLPGTAYYDTSILTAAAHGDLA